jgi:hypothetical protein
MHNGTEFPNNNQPDNRNTADNNDWKTQTHQSKKGNRSQESSPTALTEQNTFNRYAELAEKEDPDNEELDISWTEQNDITLIDANSDSSNNSDRNQEHVQWVCIAELAFKSGWSYHQNVCGNERQLETAVH